MTATYRIRPVSNTLDYFILHVSRTQKEMNACLARWYKRNNEPIQNESNTAGLVHTSAVREFAGETDGWYNICFGHMFLNEERLTSRIIAHECLHISMAHERYINHFDMMYAGCYDGCDENEERLAYYVGDAVQAVMKELSRGGHWKRRKGK
jgi:hypothetical protein